MRIHWLGHVPFEDAANIDLWARRHGHEVTATRLYEVETPPDVAEIDALAVMGGPMNVYQYRRFPWLVAEKRFIERAVDAGIPIVGVCLGGQLIADVLGAKVVENPYVEIGWFDIQLTDQGRSCGLFDGASDEFMAFHWHGDTFAVPSGATPLASSRACENQAFLYGDSVLALQCHLEYSKDSIDKMLTHCGDELVEAAFVQTAEQILANMANVEPARQLLFAMLDCLMTQRRGSSEA